MAYGQALARGIQLGEASRRGNELNLESIIASLPGTRGWSSRRSSPATIRSKAADQALMERKMDLMERAQQLEERKQALEEQKWETVKERQRQADVQRYMYGEEGAALGVRGRAERAGDRAHAAATRAAETGIQAYEYSRGERMRAQMEDYNLAKAGFGSGNPAPVIDYFDKYGSSNMRVEDIQFGTGPHDPVNVVFSNKPDQPVTFQNTGQAMAMLLAPTNPAFGALGPEGLREERKVKAKEEEVAIKREKGKELSAKDEAELLRKISADVDKEILNGGRPAEYATDAEWRTALMERKKREVFRAAEKPTGPAPAQEEQPGVSTAQAAAGPQFTEIPIVNKRTGERGVRKVFADGTQEIIDSKGQLVERRMAEGRRYQPPTETRGEVHTLPIPREGEGAQRAGAIPERPGAGAAPSRNVMYHTDAEGNKVASWVNKRGEVESRVVDAEGEGEGKKKKKKKGKKGSKGGGKG